MNIQLYLGNINIVKAKAGEYYQILLENNIETLRAPIAWEGSKWDTRRSILQLMHEQAQKNKGYYPHNIKYYIMFSLQDKNYINGKYE